MKCPRMFERIARSIRLRRQGFRPAVTRSCGECPPELGSSHLKAVSVFFFLARRRMRKLSWMYRWDGDRCPLGHEATMTIEGWRAPAHVHKDINGKAIP